MNPSEYRLESLAAAPYNSTNYHLQNVTHDMFLAGVPEQAKWYTTKKMCLKRDPTLISRYHIFPDVAIPDGIPQDPAAASRICLNYQNAWPMTTVDAAGMVEVERNHPTVGFFVGAPATVAQIDAESQLRRLDQPLTRCQAVIADDAPLYYNTVAPPTPMGVPPGVQNAGNPVAVLIVPGADECRHGADNVVSAMSGRRFNNPTRQDTMRMDRPFAPPGTGRGQPRGAVAVSNKTPYYA